MESNHLKVKSSNSDLSKNSSTNNNHENNENIDQGRKTLTSLDPSTFSEGSVQTQLMDKIIDDEQIQQLGYDLEVNIPKTVLDEIFYSYFLKQRSFGLIWFLISSIHFDAYCVWLQYTNSWISFGKFTLLIFLNILYIKHFCLFVCYVFMNLKKFLNSFVTSVNNICFMLCDQLVKSTVV